MHNIASLRVKEVAAALDLKGVRTVLDLGGGPGTYAAALARKGLDVTLYDRPETMRMARDAAKKAGVKLRFRKGDFITDPLGKGYDLVFISQIFHAYPEDENIELLKKCADSLNPGGGVAVQETPVSEDLTQPATSALFSVNMLVNTVGGRCYSPAEIKGWLRRTGFKDVAQKPLGDTVLILARKK
jgi:2-polyprenyl-3-methyl-5-hydroxy-6-metoxy-1,4-benzoquinol methylase